MKEKKRIVYVLLGAFFGFLGVHSYYAGNKLKALFQFICGAFIILVPLAMLRQVYLLALLPFIISYLWALYDTRTHYADVEDRPMIDDYPRLSRWLPLCINVFLPLAVFLIYSGCILVPAIMEGQEKTDRIDCIRNLGLIGTACQFFALEHSGRYPDLETEFKMLEKYDKNVRKYFCPSKRKLDEPYLFIGGYRGEVSAKAPVAIERLSNHPGFITILRANGAIDSISYKKRRYFDLAAYFYKDVTKDEFEHIKRKFREFDIPKVEREKMKAERLKAEKLKAEKAEAERLEAEKKKAGKAKSGKVKAGKAGK